jgi:hypothetical protein
MVNSISPGDRAIIMCPKGGLGNRIINLIGGIFFARTLNCKFFVHWKPCHLCDCEFYDIFASTDITFLTSCEYKVLKEQSDLVIGSPVLKTEKTIFDRGINKLLHIELVTQDLLLKHNIITHTCHILPNFINNCDIISILSELLFRGEIYKKAYEFIREHNINYKDKGYHGRFTDCYNRKKDYSNLNNINKQNLLMTITEDKDNRYFVCSCDHGFEQSLNTLDNVIYRPKEYYPEFFTSYNDLCSNASDFIQQRKVYTMQPKTLFPLNYITKDAVIEGIIDMLILSRTNMVEDIPSTFWDLAKWYNQIYIGKTFIKINNKIIFKNHLNTIYASSY